MAVSWKELAQDGYQVSPDEQEIERVKRLLLDLYDLRDTLDCTIACMEQIETLAWDALLTMLGKEPNA
jgi:hypothetical protein